MKLAIGADHRGFAYKQALQKRVHTCTGESFEWLDVGALNEERSDYPIFAQRVVRVLQEEPSVERGVLICGSGIGMAVAANRFHGMYAGVVWNVEIARLSREHDNTNILVIPSDFVSEDAACAMLTAWLEASFLNGRYKKRIELIDGDE